MRSCTQSGITLIEVVAGLALMGTLLTVVLISSSQHLRQLKLAEKKRASVEKLDSFLATWSIGDFRTDRIAEAVQQSGLPAVGQFGRFDLDTQDPRSATAFQVELNRVRESELGSGVVIRLAVSIPTSDGERIETAWAEVIVRS